MIIRHLDDGREMAVVGLVPENGELVERLVPVEEEIARRRETLKARKAKAEAEPSPKPPRKPSVTPLEATLILARRGRKEILPKLRQILDENPELFRVYGDLTLQAQEAWLRLLSGKDLYLLEGVRRHLDEMRNQLAGPSATALEKLLVDRLLACHVELAYFTAVEAQQVGGDNPKLAQFRVQRQDQANRQLLAAAKTLATVRQLQCRTVILGVPGQQPVSPASVESIIPGPGPANGEEPPNTSRNGMGLKASEANGTGSRINGHDRFRENRVAHVLEKAAGGK